MSAMCGQTAVSPTAYGLQPVWHQDTIVPRGPALVGPHWGPRSDMIFYVMFCYFTLRYVMLCYVMLCYVKLCYVMLCYVMLCYVVLCCVVLCCDTI